ncbi:FAD:protein FMN transferase [bacterium]|nr:FAD:protein FMN transferase [bacterium]
MGKKGFFVRFQLYALLLVGLILLLLGGCWKNNLKQELIEFSGLALGTTYSIKIANLPDKIPPGSLNKEIDSLLKEIEASMSIFPSSSEISQFNQYTKTDWFRISPQILEVIKESIRISKLSDGAFDITTGGLIDLWGFGKKVTLNTIPDSEKIRELKSHIGYEKIITMENPAAIRKKDPNLAINLSAIAKGFAVDKVAELFGKKGIPNYLVEIGGEIRTGGFKQGKKLWVVAIERPEKERRTFQRIVKMKNNGMATSGDYRNFFEINQQRFSHTLDPETGRPVVNNLASVSVIHDSCMTADALATAFMVLGEKDALSLAEHENLAVFIIVRTKKGLEERMSSAFKLFLESSVEL